MLKKPAGIASLLLLVVGSSLLIMGWIPAKRQADIQILKPAAMSLKQGGEASAVAILEDRRVRLEWPRSMRIGEMANIQLVFEEAGGESSSPADITAFENVYKNYNLMGEARFEAAGLVLQPANPTRESMPRGRPIRFKWEIRSDKTGWYEGTVWLSLRFLPLDGSAPVQVPIYVREVKLHSTSLLGLSGPMARIVGGVGMVVGLGLVLLRINNTKGTKDTKDTKGSENKNSGYIKSPSK